jgi:hypothetical protein
VFGVFDYYDDPNVQIKHKRAYDRVKAVLAQYEATNGQVFHSQQLQKAWREFNVKQAFWMGAWARWWAVDTLQSMDARWLIEYSRAKLAGDVPGEYFAQQTRNDIGGFVIKAMTGHFTIDTSIFT